MDTSATATTHGIERAPTRSTQHRAGQMAWLRKEMGRRRNGRSPFGLPVVNINADLVSSPISELGCSHTITDDANKNKTGSGIKICNALVVQRRHAASREPPVLTLHPLTPSSLG